MSRLNFELVYLQDLDASFQQVPTKKDKIELASNLGIPVDYLVHEIVFAAPRSRLTEAYKAWQNEQDPEKKSVQVKTMAPDKYIAIHGEDSITQFIFTMMTHGHPLQPVRSIRDSRRPNVETLDDTHTYVAEP